MNYSCGCGDCHNGERTVFLVAVILVVVGGYSGFGGCKVAVLAVVKMAKSFVTIFVEVNNIVSRRGA